jgi:hypothetical protein
MKRPTLSETKTFFYQNAPFVMDEYEQDKIEYGEFRAALTLIDIFIDYQEQERRLLSNG